jgi:DNA-binding CsgD family transcriptional regulator
MRLVLGWVAYAEGDLDGAEAELEEAFHILTPLMPRMAALCRALEANAVLAQSRRVDARDFAAEALKLGQENDSVWTVEWALAAQASLAQVEGDAHRAEDLLHDQLDLVCRTGHRPVLCDTLEAIAGAMADEGRLEEAARLFGAAEAGRGTIGYVRFPVLRSNHEAATESVRAQLGAEVFDRAWGDGMSLALDDAVAYARRGRGHRKRPTHGWHSLTPTELQVVELVAQGLTNPQIGKRLFVSPRTVKAHLAHVFAKVGVSTRAELAAIATQRRAAGDD